MSGDALNDTATQVQAELNTKLAKDHAAACVVKPGRFKEAHRRMLAAQNRLYLSASAV